MRFSKFAQNSPENDIHVKQESIPPYLGIVGDKKWSPFLDLGIRSPIFCTENHWKWPFSVIKLSFLHYLHVWYCSNWYAWDTIIRNLLLGCGVCKYKCKRGIQASNWGQQQQFRKGSVWRKGGQEVGINNWFSWQLAANCQVTPYQRSLDLSKFELTAERSWHGLGFCKKKMMAFIRVWKWTKYTNKREWRPLRSLDIWNTSYTSEEHSHFQADVETWNQELFPVAYLQF